MVTKGFLHYTILKHIIDKGFAPDLETLSEILVADKAEIEERLYELRDDHGSI